MEISYHNMKDTTYGPEHFESISLNTQYFFFFFYRISLNTHTSNQQSRNENLRVYCTPIRSCGIKTNVFSVLSNIKILSSPGFWKVTKAYNEIKRKQEHLQNNGEALFL